MDNTENTAPTKSGSPLPNSITRARELVLRYGWSSTAYQIINPGISLWFSAYKEAVVGYVECYGFRIVAGVPVCSAEDFAGVVNEFEEAAQNEGLHVCYFGAGQRLANILEQRGPFDRILLGAEPVWDPPTWMATLTQKASLRAQLYRASNKDIEVHQWQPEQAENHPALEQCLQEWLETRGLPPLHFLVEPDTLGMLLDRQVFVAEQNGEVVGFLVMSPIPLRNGWLIEQIIRGRKAPNGTNELLLDAAMQNLVHQKASFVSLGLSPLSHHIDITQAEQSLAIRFLLTWVRAHGNRFYNFKGLDAFKAKFIPDGWEPIYAITNEKKISMRTLYAIAGAFSGSSPLLFLARGAVRALYQELRWLGRQKKR